MAEIDKGLVLRLEATTLLLSQQLRAATGEVEGFASKSTRAITVSSAQQQNAIKNLGFQFNDFLTQVQGGTPLLRAFAQQSGQAAGALADMGGKAGVVGRFFSGILGGGILAAGTALATYLLTMEDTNEALDLAKTGTDGLADAQTVLGQIFDLTSGKLKSQNELLRLNAQLTAANLRAESMREAASAKSTFAKAGDVTTFGGAIRTIRTGQTGDEMVAPLSTLMNAVRGGRLTRQDALKRSETIDFSGLAITREQFQQALIDELSAAAKGITADKIERSLTTGVLDPDFRRTAPKGRTRRAAKISDADAEAQALGYADAKAQRDAIDRAKEGMAERDRVANPFPAVAAGASKFGKEIGETLGKAREGVMNLSVAMVDADTATMKLFKTLQQEGDNVDAAINEIAADGLENLGDGIADAIAGARSLGEAFSNVADQIIADLVRIAVRQGLIRPLAGAIGGTSFQKLLGFAEGGDPPVGEPFIVGERGPEIMMTKTPTTVIPNHEIGRFGGQSISINVPVDARGATDPAIIEQAAHRAIFAAAPLIVAAAQGRTMSELQRPMLPTSAG